MRMMAINENDHTCLVLIGSWPRVRLQPDVSSAAEDPTTTVEVTDDFKENVKKSSKARKSSSIKGGTQLYVPCTWGPPFLGSQGPTFHLARCSPNPGPGGTSQTWRGSRQGEQEISRPYTQKLPVNKTGIVRKTIYDWKAWPNFAPLCTQCLT